MALILEPRFLFDASVAPAVTKPVADATHVAPDAAAVAADKGSEQAAPAADGNAHPAEAKATAASDHATPPAAGQPAEVAPPQASTTPQPSSVLFVDPRVADWQQLAASVSPGTKVVVIDPTLDGIAQVTKALDGMRGVEHVDFLTYGTPGQIEFGATPINDAALHANAAEVAGWRNHLADTAQIDFWGCDVGAGNAGAAFVGDLHALTGVAVAASADATGLAALGGNWTLETTAGSAHPTVPFSAEAVASFQTVLDAPIPTVTLTAPGAILLGDTFTETVTFQNTAANGIGYGPFIDVFVPHDSLDSATLTSATYLGFAVPVSDIVLSTDVPGHAGVLGAIHPLEVDSSGNPLFVAAPAGTVAGDHMYVLQLPFGSFAPGQPAVPVTLTFQLDKTSVATNLSSAAPGQTFNVEAIGGFIYGADALNNPGADAPIRGTAGTPGVSAAGDGLASASAPVQLAVVSARLVTPPGEGESATGPDFVEHYQFVITPAPATVGNPITGLTGSFALPDNLQYTGGAITITGTTGTANFSNDATPQGGQVDVSVPSVSGPGSIVIDVPVFVPQTAADGTPVLDPVTGAPTTIISSPASYSGGTWDPYAGSADAGTPYTLSGTGTTSATMTAKSLAVQVGLNDLTSGSASNLRPGDEVQFKLNFEVSDFFNFTSLTLQALLDDGFTVDPTVAATLTLTAAGGGATTTIDLGTITPVNQTVSNQVVATTGSNANWNFSRDNAGTGDTTVNLTPSAAILAALGSAQLTGGETGTVTFNARVLDRYTNSHIDNSDPGGPIGGSIAELDTVHADVSGTGTVVTNLGLPTSIPVSTVTDTSQGTLAVPQGSSDVFVAAVNGVAVPPGTAATIQPSDTVTYGVTYHLVTGDYTSLSESAFMPLPVISVTDPLSNGGSVTAFTQDLSGATFPGAGLYRLVNPPPGVSVVSADVDAANNGITFDLGHRDDTTNAANQDVTVYFTFTVTDKPFADGLDLTAQGQSTFTNSSGTPTNIVDISQVTLQEPSLATLSKVGIASLVNDADAAKTGGFTVQGTGAAGDPSTLYQPATSDLLFVNGSKGPFSVGDLQDLNVTGADGSDTVRVILTVDNSGSSSGGAYDVTVSSLLPAGYTLADVLNIGAVRSGSQTLLAVNQAYAASTGGTGTMADLFTTSGVMLEDPTSTASTPHPTLFGVNDSLHRNVLTVAYDLKLHADQPAGAVLTETGTLVNYTNVFDGVAQGFGFVSPAAPPLSDTATVTTTSPALAKAFSPSDIPQDDNVDPGHPNATVVVGETRPITITVDLPEGSINNGSGHVLVTEQLPANEVFRDLVSITGGTGVTLTPSSTASVSGQTVTFDLGPVVSNSNADTPGTVTITYNAYFADGANTDGTLFTSTANLVYSGTGVPPVTATFVEHDPTLSATLTDNAGGVVFTNKAITYTYTIANNGLVQSQTTGSLLNIPAGLAYVPGSLHLVSQTGSADSSSTVNDGTGATGTISVTPRIIDAGGVLTYTFQATVVPDLAAGTDLTVAAPPATSSGLSIAAPQAPATAREYTFTANDPLSVPVISTTLLISGEANGTTVISAAAPVTSANVTIGDITRLHAQVRLPEGTNANVVLDFTLPAGLAALIADGTVKLALISDNGDITSSTFDPAGNTPGLQVAEGTTSIDPTTFAPTFVVPAAAIDTTSVPGHLRVSLGTVSDNGVSPLPNYAVLEFNGLPTNVLANQDGVVLAPSLVVAANGGTSPASAVTETIVEPHVTMNKVVTAIDSAAGSVTYQITLTNTGDATAYALSLTDPLPANTGSISGLAGSGGATGLVLTPGSGNVFSATMTLAAGQTETFTYTLVVADPTQPVPATTATETFRSLNPLVTTAFGSTVGAAGSATGSRDGSSLPNTAGLNDYFQQVTTSLGTASGQIWQALGNTPATFDSLIDTPLASVTLAFTSPGPDGLFGTADDLHQTRVSAIDGTWLFGLIPNGAFRVTLPPSGSSGLPASETLVVNTNGPLSTPAQASGTAAGTAQTGMNFVYELPDTAPVLSNWTSSSAAQIIVPAQVVHLSTTFDAQASDSELDALLTAHPATYSYNGTVLTVQRYVDVAGTPAAAPDASDVFGGDGQLTLTSAAVILNGVTIGTFTQAAGALAITFTAGTTRASVQGVLNHLTYSNATNAIVPSIVIGATLSDANNPTAVLALTGQQGTGGPLTSAPVFSVLAIDTGARFNLTYVEPNNTPAADSAIALPGGNLNLSGITLNQVDVQLTGTGFVPSEDVLLFTANPSTMGDITSAGYNPATGLLTLTSASGASEAQWQAAAAAIHYYNSSDTPHTGTRDVAYTFTVSSGVAPTGGVLGHIAVVAANDSPVLDTGVSVSLVHATEDQSIAPSGAVGTTINTLVGVGLNIADPDNANAHDGSAPVLPGLAITSADTTHGDWWFSTDGGATWTRFAGAGLTAVSDTNALHLVADGNTRVYFQPTTADFNGTIPVALGFRAWDQADGAANGTLSALPTDAPLATGTNTQASAYSAAVDVIPQTVDPVNDAPVANGTTSLATEPEDTTTPVTSTVFNLFNATFSDTVDDQTANLNGSSANALAGIAIVANSTPASEGVWRYSIDGGASWTDLPTVSNTGALVLSDQAQLEFVPAANFNGTPSGLQVRVIDSSDVFVSNTTTTGHDLQAAVTPVAINGVDVSGANNGGTTADSAGTVPLTIDVSAVNDAPVASGAASFVVQEDATSPSATVQSLFAATFSDTADQQQSVGNPTGSLANQLAGVAITANSTPVSEGVWRYSTDGGATWTNVPTAGLSDVSALVLSASVQLDFVPAPDFNTNTPTGLTVRLIDSSTEVVTGTTTGSALLAGNLAISSVDVTANGLTTAVSADTVPLNMTVAAVNDAPIASGATDLGAQAEDGAPNVATVQSLFAANFSDTTDDQTANNGSSANLLAGIAITGNAAPESMGEWRYSTNLGLTWNMIPTNVSPTNALVLSQSVRLEFLPAPDYNGIPPLLVARLIDSSTETVGSTTGAALLAGLPQAIAGVDVSGAHSGGTTPVSIATVSLGVGVTAVNDAPVATGSAGMGIEAEDTSAPIHFTVQSLFAGRFSDTADQQRSLPNPFGSDANSLAGIAITGNATPANEGTWRYSIDGGTTWTAIPTGLSANNALVLSRAVELEFLPTANFNGIPVPLTARLIDTSNEIVTGTMTGLDLVSSAQAISGVDVSGVHSGGTTAVSTAEVPLSIVVSPVNDAPTAAGSATLAAGTNGSTPPSDTVASLFGPSFGDAVDQQRSAINPTGSVSDSLAGIVVVGNTTPAADGVWEYSVNGGASWTAVPTSVGDRSGLLLGSAVRLAFFPSATFSGSPPPLTVRLVDTSTDVPVFGTLTGAALAGSTTAISGIDVSGANNGGTTAISVGLVPLTTSVVLPPPTPSGPSGPSGPSEFVPPTIVLDPAPSARIFDENFLTDGGREPGFLVGANVYRVLLAERPGTLNVSADVFYGSEASRYLRFEAKTAGGGPLPPWLYFDPTLLRFSGIPPLSAVGTLDLEVIARDRSGREATADVHVIITRPPRDIMPLLRPFSAQKAIAPIIVPPPLPGPPAPPAAAPDQPPATPPSDQTPTTPAGPPLEHPTPQGVWLMPEVWPAGTMVDGTGKSFLGRDLESFGLSSQLREQSLAGRLARSRALLSALATGGTPS
jgi:large repetitive protein